MKGVSRSRLGIQSLLFVFPLLVAFPLAAQDLGSISRPVWTVRLDPAQPEPGKIAVARVEVRLPQGYYQDADSSFLGLDVEKDWPTTTSLNEGPLGLPAAGARAGRPSYVGTFTMTRSFRLPEGRLPPNLTLKFSYQICQIDGVCLLPRSETKSVSLESIPSLEKGVPSQDLLLQSKEVSRMPNVAAWMLALGAALLGGLVLNFMPCVFPVLSLKALAIARAAAEDRRRRRSSLLRFVGGEIVSLLVLGFVVAAIKFWGGTPVWGGMFQYPAFVFVLVALFWFFALNLWELGPRFAPSFTSAPASDFWSGALKVVAAAPCTAPFLGPAMGFAFALPPPAIPIFFVVTAVGLALPDLALAAFPGIFRFLPKPGSWSRTFEKIMGFLLAGTALYLAYVFWQLAGSKAFWWLLTGLWLFTAALALGETWTKRSRSARWTFYALLTAAVFAWAWGTLAPRPADPGSSTTATVVPPSDAEPPEGWVSFDREALTNAVKSGRPVFVDATAAWCATCLVNEAGVLSDPDVRAELKVSGALLMRADFTRPSALIAQWLGEVGRAGLPVYALYTQGRTKPYLFPELLEKSGFLAAFRSVLKTGSDRG